MFTPLSSMFYPCFCSFKPRHPSNWGAHVHSTNLSALPLEAEDDCSRQQSCGVAAEPHTPGHPLATRRMQPSRAAEPKKPLSGVFLGDGFLVDQRFFGTPNWEIHSRKLPSKWNPKVMEVSSRWLIFPFVLFRFCVSSSGGCWFVDIPTPPPMKAKPRMLWVVLLPSNSHHQDHYIFGRGSINLYLPLLLGGGTTQLILTYQSCYGHSLPCGVVSAVRKGGSS